MTTTVITDVFPHEGHIELASVDAVRIELNHGDRYVFVLFAKGDPIDPIGTARLDQTADADAIRLAKAFLELESTR